MCLVALFYRVAEDAPLIVGANREEDYSRPGDLPQLHTNPALWIGGVDPRAGGTWFGINAHGVLIAVTNRRKTDLPAEPRSRGLLVRELLACSNAGAASEQAGRELSTNRYLGCNVLCLDSERAIVLHGGDWLRMRFLPPGLHVLSNGDINDASDRRVAYALEWLSSHPYRKAAECVSSLTKLCADNDSQHGPICLHGATRGTVCSSIAALRRPLAGSTYLHAQGSPDRVAYQDYSSLLGQLSPPRA